MKTEQDLFKSLQQHLPPGRRTSLVVLPKNVLQAAAVSICIIFTGLGMTLGPHLASPQAAAWAFPVALALAWVIGIFIRRMERRHLPLQNEDGSAPNG